MATIDYKEKYEQALERARQFSEKPYLEDSAGIVEYIFPELAESEDERIRREMIEIIKNEAHEFPSSIIAEKSKSWISWLEKQREPAGKMQVSEKLYEHIRNTCACIDDALSSETLSDINDYLSMAERSAQSAFDMIEKQGEQRSTDKVEPKFHEGDWAVSNLDGKARQISEVHFDEYNSYYVVDGKSVNLEEYDRLHHLWTIQDAKDGDILCTYECCEPKIVFILKGTPKKHYALSYHCYYNIMYPHFSPDSEKGCLAPNDEDVKPATKEQRDLLFTKMKKEGYEWDAEKKEPKKIEQKQVIDYPDSLPKDNWELVHEFVEKFGGIPEDEDELNALVEYVLKRQKPVWSEDDESNLDLAIYHIRREPYRESDVEPIVDWLRTLKDRVLPQPKQEWSEEDENRFNNLIFLVECSDENGPTKKGFIDFINRLRTLRPQNTWKPSEEQMNALSKAIAFVFDSNSDVKHSLESLYNELKKL